MFDAMSYILGTKAGGGGGGSSVSVKPLSVTENGTYTAPEGKAYSPVSVNVPAPTPSLQSKSITMTQNGTQIVEADSGYDGLSSVSITANVSGGGGSTTAEQKDVNFIDYDGTIVHSYTASEFAALSAMPENPAHAGLTAQGWNWTLADAKAYVADYGKLWIGQMYITDDGKTRIYIHLEEGRLSPMLGVGVNGTVDVDWGDGTAHNTLTGTSASTTVWTPRHNYAAAGDYVIKLTVTGEIRFNGDTGNGAGSCLLRYSSTTSNTNYIYRNVIKKIEIGNNVTSIGKYAFSQCYNLFSIAIPANVTSIDAYAFDHCYNLFSIAIPANVTSISTYTFTYCYNLFSIAIPANVTSIDVYAFNYCYNLFSITIPANVTSIDAYAFKNCYSLFSITIPANVTSIDANAFENCYSLPSITIPASVTSINAQVFRNCYGLGFIKFESSTPPTASNAWTGIPTDCIIYVPAGSLSAYTSAANYPSSSTYTYVEY